LRQLKLTFLLLSCYCLLVVPAQAESARVNYVIDGDTVILDDKRHVRLLAINAPEVEGTRHAEPGGEAAKHWLKRRVEGETVQLVGDEQSRDKYGRSLFYLFDSQGQLVNEQLLAKGLAVLSIHPPNLKYLARLQAAQSQAQRQRRGLWSLPEYQLVSLNQAIKEKRRGWQRVLVKPQGVSYSRKYRRLVLGLEADIRIRKANLGYFPALKNYQGCQMEVRGWLSWRKGQLSILVRHPSQLLIKDSNKCAETL